MSHLREHADFQRVRAILKSPPLEFLSPSAINALNHALDALQHLAVGPELRQNFHIQTLNVSLTLDPAFLKPLIDKVNQMNQTVQDLAKATDDSITELGAEVSSLSNVADLFTRVHTEDRQTIASQLAMISALQAQIAAGEPVTEADLQALTNKLVAATSASANARAALVAAVNALVAPPAPADAGAPESASSEPAASSG